MINWLRRLSAKLRSAHWHPETLVCSPHGHVPPAARVARLRPEDGGVGVDFPDGRRLFGIAGGRASLVHEQLDPAVLLAPPEGIAAVPAAVEPR